MAYAHSNRNDEDYYDHYEMPSPEESTVDGDALCGTCNGSGEGQTDGSICLKCGGSGMAKGWRFK